MTYARHIKNGLGTYYAAVLNAAIDKAVRARVICAACGRKFSDKLAPSKVDPSLCAQCQQSL